MADDLCCSARFGFRVDRIGDGLDDHVIGVEGIVVAHLEPAEDDSAALYGEAEVTRVIAFVAQATQAITDGVLFYDAFDSHEKR